MNLILFDDERRKQFFPFTPTRPLANIRCGILTIRERWEKYLEVENSSTLTEADLQKVFPLVTSEDNYFVNGAVVATTQLATEVRNLKSETSLFAENGSLLAFRTNKRFDSWSSAIEAAHALSSLSHKSDITQLEHVWDIFSFNAALITQDFQLLTKNKTSLKLPDYVTAVHPENIFVEERVKIAPCIINATDGVVYIGKEAEIMEGCLIRGSFCLGEQATLKMGAKVYGGTTIGPHCKVGGEVNNAVFFNYSNKGHDGFIGNAVIGDWCNLGADTNCSNLKNNYDIVKIWDEASKQMTSTGLQFCGLLMGDHSKCGINTMFNTGTVVGISCNIFGAGFPPKHIPHFTWGGVEESTNYKLEKAMDTANRMMERRDKKLSEEEKNLWKKLYDR